MQTLAGHVIDEDEYELEVWVSEFPTGEIEHVFIMYGGSQLGDFPFNQPRAGEELEQAAQMIAARPSLKKVSLPLLLMDD